MISLNDVINFLVDLLGDPDRLAAFDADPDAELQKAGLDGLTGQDVRDAQLVMADTGVTRSDDDNNNNSARSGGGDDPVQAIHHTTRNFTVTEVASPQNIITIDDRDTFINDSFNSDDDITAIDAENSFNKSVENDVVAIQDNDTIINDNDTVDVDVEAPGSETPDDGADSDTEEPQPDPGPPNDGIPTEDLVDPGSPEPEPVSAEVEPEVGGVQDIEPEPEPEPEVSEPVDEADADVDGLDVAAV